MSDRSIQQHINDDKDMLEKGTLSPQMRRHITDELDHLEQYQSNHPDDDHDPTSFEMYCDEYPEADEVEFTRIDGDSLEDYLILDF